jgi:acetolactate synthase-1/2/3 large subunit
MKVSDIVVNFLESKGITHVFTVSGGGCIHLTDSLGKAKNLKYICVHHEQSAAMAAEGYARLRQDVGACVITTGPGGTNTLTGVLGCWLDSVPTIFISGQVSLSQIAEGTGCRQIGDQEFDIVSTVKPMTKYATMIKDKNDILYELEKAYNIAISGRPGPVWIDIPLDIQGAMVSDSNLKKYTVKVDDVLTLNNEEVDTFMSLLKGSKKPLFVVGSGIRLSNSYDLLDQIVKQTGIPTITGVHSGVDCVDNSYQYYAGRFGILGQISANKVVQEADLLVVLGSRLNIKMTGYNFAGFAPNAKKVFVDIDKFELDKHKLNNIALKINANVYDFLKALPVIDGLDIVDWQQWVRKSKEGQKYYYDKHANMKEYASAYYFTDRLKHYAKDNPIITSNGSAHVVTLQTFQLSQHQRMFTNVGCASMGYGLPAAIGACFVDNYSDIVCIEGDGSLQMNIQELQTMVHHQLPLKLFVINNDGYLSIKITQGSFFNGKEVASGKESGISFPDLAEVARAYGIPFIRINSNSEYDDRLDQVFKTKGPIICELMTHPREKHEPKVTHKGIDSEGRIIPGELTDSYVSDDFNL